MENAEQNSGIVFFPINKAMSALVDIADYRNIKDYKWHIVKKGNTFYARWDKRNDFRHIVIFMHHLILGDKEGLYIDHINGNGLDNRRCNLRHCSHKQNMANRYGNSNSSSKYKGVSWHKDKEMWCAYIFENNKLNHLGYFINEHEASLEYNKNAERVFREFAKLNKVCYE
jgi:hypothetical protein